MYDLLIIYNNNYKYIIIIMINYYGSLSVTKF